MADNVPITPGTGVTVAADEIAGVIHQRIKIQHGADGSATDVSSASPLPVDVSGAGLTALQLIDDAVHAEDVAHVSGDKGLQALAVRKDTATALAGTDGDYAPLEVDSTGRLHVNAGTLDVTPAAPVATDYLPVRLTTGTDWAAAGTEYDEGAVDTTITGVAMLWEDTGDTLRAPSAAKPLPVAIITGAGSGGTAMTDDAVFTPGTTSVTPMAGLFDDVAPDSVNEGDGGVVRMSANRNLYSTIRDAAGNERGANVDASGQLSVNQVPQTTGGLSIFRSIDLDETEEEVKATAGQVYQIWFTNTATSTRWLKLYNATAANVTVGTTTPVITIGLPGNTSDNVSGALNAVNGIAFSTAITAAITTGAADTDTGAPAANECVCNIFFK